MCLQVAVDGETDMSVQLEILAEEPAPMEQEAAQLIGEEQQVAVETIQFVEVSPDIPQVVADGEQFVVVEGEVLPTNMAMQYDMQIDNNVIVLQ